MSADCLRSLRVVELTADLAGAFCGREFALWGASVQRIGGPHQEARRNWSPTRKLENNSQVSLLWKFLDGQKQVVDAGPEELTASVWKALDQADVFITDWTESELQTAGMDLTELCARFPGLVISWLPALDSGGPYRSWQSSDLVVEALSGFLSVNGQTDGPPLKAPANVLPYACGSSAFLAALAAVWERSASGQGQLIATGGIEAAASLVRFLRTEYIGWPEPRHGGAGPPPFACRDGYITANVAAPDLWEKCLVALGGDGDAARIEVLDSDGQVSPSKVVTLMERHLKTVSAREAFEVCNQLQISAGLVLTPAQVLRDVHLAARGYLQPTNDADLGSVTYPHQVATVTTSNTSTAPAFRRPSGDLAQPPLAGVRVLDFTQALMGPFATTLLADLGADVIKVESPKRPDVWRMLSSTTAPKSDPHWPEPRQPDAHPWNTNHLFNSANRNKRAITLDLTSPDAKRVFGRLLETVDVMVVNYTPRVLDNFGFTPEFLWSINPGLIVVDVSGYGRSGPYRNYKANGATIEAISGWMSLFHEPNMPPFALGAWQSDSFCGLRMAGFALAGLIGRATDGRGRYFETSMQGIAVDYIGEEILNASVGGEVELHRGNRHLDFAPSGVFPAAGEDRWVAITIRDDKEWASLLTCVDEENGLHDPTYASKSGRRGSADALNSDLCAWTRTQDRDELARRLQALNIAAAPVLELDEVLRDEHFVSREWFKRITHPDLGEHRYNGFPWRFGRSVPAIRYPPPRLGEHSREVIVDELGFSPEEYEHLVSDGASGPTLTQ